jgi:hypothetical protein
MLDDEFDQIVCDAWDEGGLGGSKMQQVRQKLSSCQSGLTRWSARKFGNAERVLKEKTKILGILQKEEGPSNWDEIKRLQTEIDFILDQEDLRWKQRAKQNWYQVGDQNTPFFHAWANHRRKINTIKRVVDEVGVEWKKQDDIGGAFVHFYKGLFTVGESQGVNEK